MYIGDPAFSREWFPSWNVGPVTVMRDFDVFPASNVFTDQSAGDQYGLRAWRNGLDNSLPESELLTPPAGGVADAADPAEISVLPLMPLERFLLQCDTSRSPMIIRLVVRLSGRCRPELFVSTLQQAISRHPLLSCRLQKIRQQLCWIKGMPEPIELVHASGTVFRPECGPVSKSMDLTKTAGLHTSILMMDDGVKVIMDAHHAVTDGNGLRQLVTEWFHRYHCAVTGAILKLPQIDNVRLQQRDRFHQPSAIAPPGRKEALRNFLVTIRGRTARWRPLVRKNVGAADGTQSYCAEVIFSDEQQSQLRERLDAWDVNLNDLVMVCCMTVFAEMAPAGSQNHLITIMNPTDLRLPSDRTLPATNRFGTAFIRRRRLDCLVPAALLRGIRDQMNYVRSNYIGVEFVKGLAVASKIPGGIGFFRRLGLFIPSMQWTCLGDVSRGGKRLLPWKDGMPVSGDLRLETVTGFAPVADDVPVSVATAEANKRLTLTVRSSPRFLTMQQTNEFVSRIMQLLCSFEMSGESCPSAVNQGSSEC